MKVAHVTPSYFPATSYGGPPRTIHRLCQALAEAGADIRVLTTDSDGPDRRLAVGRGERELASRLRVRYAARVWPESVSTELLGALPSLIRWADIVHLSAVYNFTTFPTLTLCRFFNKPLVWSPRGALERWAGTRRPAAKKVFESIARSLAPAQRRLHVTSRHEENCSRARLPEFPTFIVPNGVDVPASLPAHSEEDRLRLLFLGRLDPKKGLENLFEACARLQGRLARRWHLTVAGSGTPAYGASLQKRVRELALDAHVTFLGDVDGAAKAAAFREADVTVVPSFTENFCMVVAESLAEGVPVIASTGTPWERVDAEGCGRWVSNAPDALAEAILGMAASPLRAMGERGYHWMQRDFTWNRVAAEMLAAYEKTLEAAR